MAAMLQRRGLGPRLFAFDVMERHAHLRPVGVATPGLLLSGWAAQVPSGPVSLVVRDVAGPASLSLRAGVSLGLSEVRRLTEITRGSLDMTWASGLEPIDADGVQVVVADQDPPWAPCLDNVTGIYTCALDEWRPPAPGWQVSHEWHPLLTRHGATALNERFLQRTGQAMDAAAWRGWMAVKVAFDLAVRRAAGEDDLLAMAFDGHKGQPLRFGEDAHLIQPTYRVGHDGRLVVVAPRSADFEN